jgi:hypothetical protein
LTTCVVASSGATARAASDPLRPTARRASLAQVIFPTVVRDAPGDGTATGRLGTEASWGGGPVRLLVLQSAVVDGRRWLEVRLPTRPNDHSGWIDPDHVRLSTTAWRIVVSLRQRTLEMRRAGRTVRRYRAVVGAADTPTPTGLFAISERIRQRSGNLGPWALHLTSHSDVLDNFGGGPGRVAIHGRSGSLLGDPLGSAVSHGCVRIDNDALSWLEVRAVEGTPVEIR